MNKIINPRFLWMLCLAIWLLPSCNRKKKECDGKTGLYFNFDIPYTITPMQDTFSVGDTIWMEFHFSNQMYNKANEKTYTVNNFEFKMYGFIIDLGDSLALATPDFTMVDENKMIDNDGDRNGANSVYYRLNTRMLNGAYSWKAGFILHRQGLYAFVQNSEIGNDGILANQSPSQHITECPNEGMSLDFRISNGNGNAYMLDYAAGDNPRGWDRARYEQVGYAFYVKE